MAVYIEGHAESLVSAAGEGSAAVDKLEASTAGLNVTQSRATAGFASYSTATTKAGTETKKATKLFDDHGRVTSKLGSIYGETAASAGALLGAYAGFEALKSGVTYTEELVHQTQILTDATGLDSKAASQWIEIAKQRGISTDQVAISFKTLSKQILEAEQGSTTAAKAFHAVGIPLDELRHLSTEEVLLKISDGFKGMGDGAQRTALNTQFFGKSATALLPVLDKGSQGIEKQLGQFSGLSESQQKAGEQAIEMQRKISRAYDQVRLDVTFDLLSAGKSVAHWVSDIDNAKGSVGKTVNEIGHFLGPILHDFIGAAGQYFEGFGQLIKGVCELIQGIMHGELGKAWQGAEDIFGGGVKAVLGILRGITAPLRGVLGGVGDAMSTLFSGIWDDVRTIFREGVNDVIGLVNDVIGVIDDLPGINIGKVGEVGGAKQGPRAGSGGEKHQSAAGYATGGFVSRPTYMVGEEAPQHPEWVIATNPAYRQNNINYWAQAGHDLGVPGFALGGIGNAVGSAASSVANTASGVFDSAKGAIGSLPTPHLPRWISGLGSFVVGQVSDWIKNGFSSEKFGGLKGLNVATGPIQQMAKALVNQVWGPGEWGPFDAVEMQEADWDPHAQNPKSTAYGLAQNLNPGTYPAAGRPGSKAPILEQAKAQLQWMVKYIKERYGNPAGAWSHEQSAGWYATGGKVGFKRNAPILSKSGEKVRSLMEQVWPFAAPFYGQSPKSHMPMANFDTHQFGGAFVGDAKGFSNKGKVTSNVTIWPQWFEGWLSKNGERGPGGPDTFKETLLHEWAHYFQKPSVFAHHWEAEGGAEAFGRWAGPQVYGAAGIPYHNPAFPKSAMYYPFVQNVLKDKGMAWVEHGQFGRAKGGLIPGFAAGGKVGSKPGSTASSSSVGASDPAAVIAWFKHHLGAGPKPGYTPGEWCGDIVGEDMLKHGIEPPAEYPTAVNWMNFGTPGKDELGNVVVIGGSGHVGIALGGGQMISGNFGNKVAVSSIAEAAGGRPILGFRKPPYATTSSTSTQAGSSKPKFTPETGLQGAVGKGQAPKSHARTALEYPGLAAGLVSGAALGLPQAFQGLLKQPGLTFAQKLGIGAAASSAAEGTKQPLFNSQGEEVSADSHADDIAASNFQKPLVQANKQRIEKRLKQVAKELEQSQPAKKRAALLKERTRLLENLGGAESSLRSLNQTIATPPDEPEEKTETESEKETAAALQELVELQKQQNLEIQTRLNVSQSQYGVLAQAITDIVSGAVGGRVGLGFETPSVAGSLASY